MLQACLNSQLKQWCYKISYRLSCSHLKILWYRTRSREITVSDDIITGGYVMILSFILVSCCALILVSCFVLFLSLVFTSCLLDYYRLCLISVYIQSCLPLSLHRNICSCSWIHFSIFWFLFSPLKIFILDFTFSQSQAPSLTSWRKVKPMRANDISDCHIMVNR